MVVRNTLCGVAVAVVGLTGRAAAQAPAIPAAPAIVPGPGIPTPQPAAPATFFQKFGVTKPQLAECMQKICSKPIGQLLANGMAPISGLSGGLIRPLCPPFPSAAELLDEGVVGAAAKVKLDEAGAKARRAAVRYLGTVDCHYWPEAEDALIGGLRMDRNECVRYEAALALGNGCCCTKKTIESLNIVVSCSDRDGQPKETSGRVHAAAHAALARCMSCYVAPPTEQLPVPKPVPEGAIPPEGEIRPPVTQAAAALPVAAPGVAKSVNPGEAKGATGQTPAVPRPTGHQYYALIAKQPLGPVLAEARRVMRDIPMVATPLDENQSLVNLVSYAAGSDAMAAFSGEPAAARGTDVSQRPTNLLDLLARGGEVVEPPMAMAAKPATPAPTSATKATAMSTAPTKSVREQWAEVSPTTAPAPTPVAKTINPIVGPALPLIATSAPAAPAKPVRETWANTTTPAAPAPVVKTAAPPAALVPVVTDETPYSMTKATTPYAAPAPAAKPAGLPTIQAPVAKPVATPAMPTIVNKPAAPAPVVKAAAPPVVPASVVKAATPAAPARPAREVWANAQTSAERLWAADNFTLADMRANPTLVGLLLMTAGRTEEVVDVRQACIRALARCQVDTPSVVAAMEELSHDSTPAVRSEALRAWSKLRKQ